MNKESASTEARISSENEQKKLLWIAIGYVVLLIAVMAVLSYVLWDRTDPIIAYVPVPILQWSFIGGVIAVLYRMAYRQNTPGVSLYIWVVAKPIIGIAMGALIYFLVLSGMFVLTSYTQQTATQTPIFPGGQRSQASVNVSVFLLCALAFIGGFSEQFSTGLIKRITSDHLAEQNDKTKD